MLDIHGLAAAHLGEWKRRRDEAMARYERGLPAAVRPPGGIGRLAALFRQVRRNRAARSAAAEERAAASCGGSVAPARIAA